MDRADGGAKEDTTVLALGNELMVDFPIVDADAHVNEPPDLWQKRVPAKLRDRAPKVVPYEHGGDAWSFDGGYAFNSYCPNGYDENAPDGDAPCWNSSKTDHQSTIPLDPGYYVVHAVMPKDPSDPRPACQLRPSALFRSSSLLRCSQVNSLSGRPK